jgi:hypothetical protein
MIAFPHIFGHAIHRRKAKNGNHHQDNTTFGIKRFLWMGCLRGMFRMGCHDHLSIPEIPGQFPFAHIMGNAMTGFPVFP